MQESPSNYSPFSERHHIRSDLQFHLGTCVKIRPWWLDFVQKSLSNNVLRRKPGTWMGLLSSNPLHRLITFRDPFQQINPSSPTLPHSKVYIGFEVCCFNNTLNVLIQFQMLIKCCSNESVKVLFYTSFYSALKYWVSYQIPSVWRPRILKSQLRKLRRRRRCLFSVTGN